MPDTFPCIDCGQLVPLRPVGSGRQPFRCDDCRERARLGGVRRRNLEARAAIAYCRFHAIDAVGWLEGSAASGETCPGGCGKPCNNADGRRCDECSARDED